MNRIRFAVLAAALILMISELRAAIIKENNAFDLNLTTSWTGGAVPGVNDIALWDITVPGANTTNLGAALELDGIQLTSVGGLVTINNTAAVLTLSPTAATDGIDLSASSQNLTIGTSLVSAAPQTWNLNSGRTLNLWTVNTSRGLSGSGNVSVVRTGVGTATVVMLPGNNGSLGFNDGNSNNTFTGNWTIGTGTTVQMIRNGRTAWGSGVINLDGGTIAQIQGNWTWTNAITLASGKTSTIANSATGTGRSLKLQGVISGNGDLTFADTTGGMTGADNGFVITGTNTLSGTVTIPASRLVRIGGVTGDDTTLGVGAGGDLGTASIINNGTLTLSRNNAWTFANNVSGSGILRIGLASGSATHIATVSGNNTHTGGTTLQTAVTLNIGSATALGTGPLTIAGNGIFDNTTGGALSLPNTLLLSGGSPTFTGSNDLTFTGATTISAANRTITVNGGKLTLAGGIGQDATARNLTKAGNGTLVLASALTYTGTTNVSAGALVVNGTHSSGGAYTVASGATLGGTGTIGSAVTVTGSVAPGNSIGTLTASSMALDGTYLLEANLAGQTDLLVISGLLSLGAGSILDLDALGSLDPATNYIIASYGTLTGSFASIDPVIAATHSIDYTTGNQITLVAIPEPSTWLLCGLCVAGYLGFRRRTVLV